MAKIGLDEFLKQRQNTGQSCHRDTCFQCFQPRIECYCNEVQTFNPNIQFIILIHPIEARKRIATGRMSHLYLQNSLLIRGQEFANSAPVNQAIQSTSNQCYVLYPGEAATNIDCPLNRSRLAPIDKNLVVFVIDGTWTTAGRMVRRNPNLASLPRIAFSPTRPSRFRVRKQPHPQCYSTIESIHYCIDKIGPHRGFDTTSRTHDRLLQAFDRLIDRQLSATECAKREGRYGVRAS